MDKTKINSCLKLLNENSYNKKSLLASMLEYCTYEELEQIYKRCSGIYKGLLSLSYLKRQSYAQIYSNSIQPRRAIKDYVGVLVYVIKRNANLINRYLTLKADIDKAVLTGNYDIARKLIEKTNKNISYSYWAATYLIKIERLDKGLNSCTSLYNRLFLENNTIVQCLYYCAFRSSSLDFLIDDVKRVLWSEKTPDAEFVNNYFISHGMPYLGFKEGLWMCSDMNSSIIDLYNNLVNFLPNLSEETLKDEKVRYYLEELSKSVNDSYVQKLCYLFKIVDDPVLDAERAAIIDHFVTSDYAVALVKSQHYLKQHVDDFEIQDINLKCLLRIGGSVASIDNNSNLIDRIRYHYSEILAHKANQNFHKRKLINICRSQYHIQGIRYMHALLEGIETDDILKLYTSTWKYLPYNSPFDASLLTHSSDRLRYTQNLTGLKDYWEQVFEKKTSLSTDCFELSIDRATDNSVFVKVLESYNNSRIPLYLKDLVVSYIFNFFISKKQYQEGVNFYVENKLKDEALSIGIKDKEVINDILDDKNLSRQIPLELSIFAEMVGSDAETIYFIYKKYLKHCGVARASEILVNGDKKQRYFLEKVAVMKVLTLHVLRFKSVLQVMEERSAICSILYDYYQDKRIDDEISSICRDIKIMELNNQVDESKIYVDDRSIHDLESEKAKELYDMFENATNQVAYHDIILGEMLLRLKNSGLSATFAEVDEDGNLKEYGGNLEMVNYRKDVLSQIFLAIRKEFLYDPKYGLDTYLSTRIRHGTLVNQLRNHFEECNLVTNTINDNYSHNEYWVDSQFVLRDCKALQCIHLFETFSRDIDSIISEIKDSFIQVKTENNIEKEQGCFDYDKKYFESDIERLMVDKSMNSFDVCFDLVMECLWQRTEKCLEIMREKLVTAQTEMLNLLHKLQRDVVGIVGSGSIGVSSFNDAVSYCQNGIQNDFQIVTKWFRRSNYVDFDFTIGQVIETSIGFIRRNNKNIFRTHVTDNSTTTLQGRYFGTLYDIFHDMLNNALDYEKKSHINEDCCIEVLEKDEYLHIQVSNHILEKDVETLKTKVDKINSELESMLITGKTRDENNSGCSKIFNAVNYHLGSNNNNYINAIENNRFVVHIDIEITPLKI